MSAITFVSVGLRLAAMWLLLLAFQVVGIYLAAHKAFNSTGPQWIAVVPAAFFVLGAFVCWKFAAPIARRLIATNQAVESLSFSVEPTVRAGCCFLGIWLLISSLPSLVRVLAITAMLPRPATASSNSSVEVDAIVYAVQLGLALCLILGHGKIFRVAFRP